MRWIGVGFVSIGAAGIFLGFLVLGWFLFWRADRLEALEAGSRLLPTDLGPVEIADTGGDGPVVLVLHGGGGGYDQGLVIAADLVEAGFRVLSLSRPGYLRTPLSSGPLPEQQADLVAAVLKELRVEKAALLGFAEGSAIACAVALRYPDSVERLAVLSPVVRRTESRPPPGEYFLPAEALLENLTGDIGSWRMVLSSRYSPEKSMAEFLDATTTFSAFESWRLAQRLVEEPGQLDWFRDFLLALSPVGPRETGIRNDLAQVRALPRWDFTQIEVPVLVMSGSADGIVPKTDAEALLEDVPRVEGISISEAGFLLPGLSPEAAGARNKLVEFFRSTE